MTVEMWRPVPGFPNYEASDLGRIRSLRRQDALGRWVGGRVLRPTVSQGYPMVAIYEAGRRRVVGVHRLVLEAHVGPAPEGTEACHADDDKLNAALSNLRWDTHSENTLDRVRNGIHHQTARTVCKRGHVLAEPNLSPWDLRRGHRTCLACARAHGLVVGTGEDFARMADEKYAVIMAGAVS